MKTQTAKNLCASHEKAGSTSVGRSHFCRYNQLECDADSLSWSRQTPFVEPSHPKGRRQAYMKLAAFSLNGSL
jgi:hypothetical protein